MTNDPYSEGYEAFYLDRPIVDCPYSATYEYSKSLDWRMGWDDAWRECLYDDNPND